MTPVATLKNNSEQAMNEIESNHHLYNTLHALVVNNLNYFDRASMSSSSHARFVSILKSLRENVEYLEYEREQLAKVVHLYDVDEKTPGNGFRSYISLMDIFMGKTITLCRSITVNRESIFFRIESQCKELETCATVFNGFRTGLEYLKKMMANNKPGDLFSPAGHMTGQELLDEYGNLDQTGFYGKYLGFYYCESMRRTLIGVSVVMASFSDLYQKGGGALVHAASSVINGGKYSLNSELRSRQIVHVAQNASIEFLKAFWSLSETNLMKQVPSWICPVSVVNEEMFIPPEILFADKTVGGGTVEIPIPSSHLPKAPVRCRLISYVHRQGQMPPNGKMKKAPAEPSSSLLFHCHGGGFVSQSPEAHEIYLRDWSAELNIPIFSIDYSLAPQAPFPRALEEILQCYVWAIQNSLRLGWTGEKIMLAGDSAGGNLVIGLALKTIDLGIRIPDKILCAYTPLILDLVPSPSRLLCVMDPLLPLGFMLSCLDAYAGANSGQDMDDEVVSPSTRSRRTSVIQALDSGIHLLMGLKNLDVEDSAVEAGQFFEEDDDDNGNLESNVELGRRPKAQRRQSSALDTSVLHKDNQPIVGHISPTASETQVPHAGDYADNFIDQYVKPSNGNTFETSFDQEEHLIYDLPNDISYSFHQRARQTTQTYIKKVVDAVTNNNFYKRHIALARVMDGDAVDGGRKAQTSVPWFKESKQVLAKKFKQIRIITSNPYMSPILASDEMLKKLPHIYFLCACYDPTLDDSVMFTRRLRGLGQAVTLDVLDKLPHGFLSFSPFSKEAHEGSRLCVRRIIEALELPAKAAL